MILPIDSMLNLEAPNAPNTNCTAQIMEPTSNGKQPAVRQFASGVGRQRRPRDPEALMIIEDRIWYCDVRGEEVTVRNLHRAYHVRPSNS